MILLERSACSRVIPVAIRVRMTKDVRATCARTTDTYQWAARGILWGPGPRTCPGSHTHPAKSQPRTATQPLPARNCRLHVWGGRAENSPGYLPGRARDAPVFVVVVVVQSPIVTVIFLKGGKKGFLFAVNPGPVPDDIASRVQSRHCERRAQARGLLGRSATVRYPSAVPRGADRTGRSAKCVWPTWWRSPRASSAPASQAGGIASKKWMLFLFGVSGHRLRHCFFSLAESPRLRSCVCCSAEDWALGALLPATHDRVSTRPGLTTVGLRFSIVPIIFRSRARHINSSIISSIFTIRAHPRAASNRLLTRNRPANRRRCTHLTRTPNQVRTRRHTPLIRSTRIIHHHTPTQDTAKPPPDTIPRICHISAPIRVPIAPLARPVTTPLPVSPSR